MKRAAILLALGVALSAACLIAQGPLPGDVAVTRALQSVLGSAPASASFLTDTAKPPWLWLTLVVASSLAHLRGKWPSAAVPPLALLAAWLVDTALRAVVFAPRPSADLVAVASPSASSGFPSTFGLFYGAMFGAVLFAPARRGGGSVGAFAAAALLVAAGLFARVVLAGHWTSEILSSLLLALSLASALDTCATRLRSRPHSETHAPT